MWSKLAAASDFLLAAAALFLSFGLFLGEARQFFPTWTSGQLDALMVILIVAVVAFMALGALLLRGRAVAGWVAALLMLGALAGDFVLLDTGSAELTRRLPRLSFEVIALLLNVKAAFVLAAARKPATAR